MTEDQLVAKFAKFMEKRRISGDVEYGPAYVKDKVSRLKRLLLLVDVNDLSSITESSYVLLTNRIIELFSANQSQHKPKNYKDYLVALRYVYEMQTKKSAPRHIIYGGKIVDKYKKFT